MSRLKFQRGAGFTSEGGLTADVAVGFITRVIRGFYVHRSRARDALNQTQTPAVADVRRSSRGGRCSRRPLGAGLIKDNAKGSFRRPNAGLAQRRTPIRPPRQA